MYLEYECIINCSCESKSVWKSKSETFVHIFHDFSNENILARMFLVSQQLGIQRTWSHNENFYFIVQCGSMLMNKWTMSILVARKWNIFCYFALREDSLIWIDFHQIYVTKCVGWLAKYRFCMLHKNLTFWEFLI